MEPSATLAPVALVVGAVLALSVLISTVRNAEVFRITSVEVTGTTRVDVAAVREMADIPPDATVFTVSEDDVRARLVLDPWIEDAQLARRLPSTLVIELVERVPAAVVDTGTEFWWVDAQGVVLGAASLDTTATTVMVRGIPDFEPVAGERSTSETLSNALAVLKGISPELRAGVRSVSAPALLETALITDGGVEVMIGEAMRLEEKSQLALRILAEEGEDVVFVDVRSLERPISRGLDDD
jgi:cell division protein FtsQ